MIAVTSPRARALAAVLSQKRHYILTTGLYFFDRVFAMVASVFVYMALARNFGPETMGVFSYAQTLVSFVAPFLAPGAEAIIVREIVRHPDRRNVIMGSAFLLLIVMTVAVIALPIIYALAAAEEPVIVQIVLLLSFSFLPNAFLVIEHFFKAEVKAAWVVVPRVLITGIAAAAKIGLAFAGYSIVSVAMVFALETVLMAVGLLAAYLKAGHSPTNWRLDRSETRFIFQQALPAMVSASVVLLFFRINHLLIAPLSDFGDLGRYSVAFQIVQVFGIVPLVIFSTIYPRLVSLYRDERSKYGEIIQQIYFAMAIVAYVMLFCTYELADWVVATVFGDRFAGTGEILVVLTLSMVFNFLGAVRAQEINIMNAPKYHLANAMVGLAVLVPASLLLIPRFGALGAAWGVAIGCLVSSVLSSFLIRDTRACGVSQIRSLLLVPPAGSMKRLFGRV